MLASRSGRSQKMSDQERFAQVAQRKWAICSENGWANSQPCYYSTALRLRKQFIMFLYVLPLCSIQYKLLHFCLMDHALNIWETLRARQSDIRTVISSAKLRAVHLRMPSWGVHSLLNRQVAIFVKKNLSFLKFNIKYYTAFDTLYLCWDRKFFKLINTIERTKKFSLFPHTKITTQKYILRFFVYFSQKKIDSTAKRYLQMFV